MADDPDAPRQGENGEVTPWIGRFDVPVRRNYRDQPVVLAEPVVSLTALGRLVSDAHRKRVRIEQVTAGWHLSYRSARSKAVNEHRFPDVVQLYRQHFERHEFPRQPDEFLRTLTSAVLRTRPDLPREDVRARATMFLAGLVRQHHFQLLLQEHFDLVVWNDDLDQRHGIDLLVIDQGRAYGLKLSVSGYTSQVWQERKRQRHPTPETFPVCQIDAPRGDFQHGRLWLHGLDDVRKVHEFVRSHQPGVRRTASSDAS